jgi:hypothetical protein
MLFKNKSQFKALFEKEGGSNALAFETGDLNSLILT